jgi:hypothetical protein
MARPRHSLGKKPISVLENSRAGVQTQVCFVHAKADLRPQSREFSRILNLFLSRSEAEPAEGKQSPAHDGGDCFATLAMTQTTER